MLRNWANGNGRRIVVAMGAVGALVGLAACGSDGGSADGRSASSGDAKVIATTPIWADVTSNVLCGEVEVGSIVPAGADAHSFEPSVQDADALRSVDLVVSNGLELEEGLHASIEAAEESGATVVELGPSLEPLDGEEHAEDEHADEEHAEDEHAEDEHHHDVDPHVWMDPDRAAAAVPLIVEALGSVDGLPVDAERIDECAAAYVDELAALSTEMDEVLATVPEGSRQLVTNHESLGYFADRFDFEVIGAVIPSTSSLGESSARDLDELVTVMTDAGVTAIFAETTGSSEVSDGLAERLGEQVAVVELFTESTGDADSGASTYIDMMRANAELVAANTGGSVRR